MRSRHETCEFFIVFLGSILIFFLISLLLLFFLNAKVDDSFALNKYVRGGVENQKILSNELWPEERKKITEKVSQLKIVLRDLSSDRGTDDFVLLLGLERALNRLPPEILNSVNDMRLLSRPLKITIVDEITNRRDKMETRGLYDFPSNQIFIKEIQAPYLYAWDYEFAFLHEIGHAYDYHKFFSYSLNHRSESDVFKESVEKESPPTLYALESPGEDFAETFVLYFLFPDYLKRVSPLRYEWMQNNLPK